MVSSGSCYYDEQNIMLTGFVPDFSWQGLFLLSEVEDTEDEYSGFIYGK